MNWVQVAKETHVDGAAWLCPQPPLVLVVLHGGTSDTATHLRVLLHLQAAWDRAALVVATPDQARELAAATAKAATPPFLAAAADTTTASCLMMAPNLVLSVPVRVAESGSVRRREVVFDAPAAAGVLVVLALPSLRAEDTAVVRAAAGVWGFPGSSRALVGATAALDAHQAVAWKAAPAGSSHSASPMILAFPSPGRRSRAQADLEARFAWAHPDGFVAWAAPDRFAPAARVLMHASVQARLPDARLVDGPPTHLWLAGCSPGQWGEVVMDLLGPLRGVRYPVHVQLADGRVFPLPCAPAEVIWSGALVGLPVPGRLPQLFDPPA